MDLPSHIPLQIDVRDIENVKSVLLELGYENTFFQIQKPKQSFGLVKELTFQDQLVDHHVRCYMNGVITTELELPRLKQVWLHLTSHSISAHEEIIEILEQIGVSYSIDEELRKKFKKFGPNEFKRDYLEFFRWFFYGVCFWVPLAYVWRFTVSLKKLFFSDQKKIRMNKIRPKSPSNQHLQNSSNIGSD